MHRTYYIKEEDKLELTPTTSLCWNVFEESINEKEIQTVNLFDYSYFVGELVAITKVCGEDFNFFAHEVYSSLLHYFWGKCEREIILTSWPAHIDKEEFNRILKDKEDREAKGLTFYWESVNLTISRKVDIFEQVMMNWEIFISYLWNNRHLLRKIVPLKDAPVNLYQKLYKYYIEKGEIL